MKIEILSLSRSQNGGVIVRVRIGDGEHEEKRSLCLSDDDACRLSLSAPTEITAERFEEIEAASELYSAICKAAELLAYGANSRRTLELKLRRRGYSDSVAARAALAVLERGLVDESSDADAIVRSCISKGYGRRRIAMKLREKGYGGDVVCSAIARTENVDFTERCRQVIIKKYRSIPSDPHESDKLVAAMSRYGYTLTEIRDAMRAVGNGD